MSAQAEVRARPAEAEVGVRGAGDVEPFGVGEDGFVAVRRVVEQHDLVARAVVVAVHGVVLGQGAPHEDDRRGVPHHLLDRSLEPGLQVGQEQGALLGEVGQQHERVRERGTGGFVARHDQKDKERGELGVAQLLAVDVRGHQCGDQVVAWGFGPDGSQAGDEVGEFLPGAQDLGHRDVEVLAEELRIRAGQDDVGVGQDHVVPVVRDAHHVADDLQWQAGRHVRNEVAGPGGQQVIDDRGGRAADVGLELGDHPRAERVGHDAAQPGVPGVVHVDHGPEVLIELGGQVGDVGRAFPGAEHVGVPAGLGHVRVPDQGVVSRTLLAERDLGLSVELRVRLGPEQREGRCPVGGRPAPERRIRQVYPGSGHEPMLRPAAFGLLEPDQHRHDEHQQHACYQPVHALPLCFAEFIIWPACYAAWSACYARVTSSAVAALAGGDREDEREDGGGTRLP